MRRSKKHLNNSPWLKSDGNGGYFIHKSTLAFFLGIIALLSCVSTVVAYTVTIKSDVDWLKDRYNQEAPEQIKTIHDLDKRLDTCDTHIAKSEVMLTGLYSDIQEIKQDVKGLITK